MSNPKLALFPISTTINPDGQLCVQNLPLADLAAQFGTPLYVYDIATLHHQIAAYRAGLAAYPAPSQLTYASKAFLNIALASLLNQAGLGLDVASVGEIIIGNEAVNHAMMHWHGNNKSQADLNIALGKDIGCIVIDNLTEAAMLRQLAHEQSKKVKVWLRINPDVAIATHHEYTVTGTAESKFGLTLDEAHGLALQLIAPDSPLDLAGLHVHIGSHFTEAEPVAQAMARLFELAAQLKQSHGWVMREFCPGGGWGVPYHPDDAPMPITPFVQSLVQAVVQQCEQHQLTLPTLILEPGRSLIAPAGVALYSVGGRKTAGKSRPQISIDGGLADNPRPALYQAKYTAMLANRAHDVETETVRVVGPYCESGDILIHEVPLPVAEPGDILAVPVAGAYQLSMSSNYNASLRPAVIFIKDGEAQQVQHRQRLEDLLEGQRNPYR
jgi:diaminopimelate decarboxylase